MQFAAGLAPGKYFAVSRLEFLNTHAHRVPSSKDTGPALGEPDVQFAADLAAFFSKARGDGKADVMVARASVLKKPKGAKPGQVCVFVCP